MADCAICAGVTGTAGLRPGVSAEPVTAHEIMTLRCMPASLATDAWLRRSLARGWGRSPEVPWRRRGRRQRRRFCAARDRRSLAFRLQDDVQVTRNRAIGTDRAKPKFPHVRGSRRCALEELLAPAGLPPIVHCAKPSLSPSLERIRSVTRAISQAPAAPWPRVGGGLSARGRDVGGEIA